MDENHDDKAKFTNALLSDWDAAMDKFFRKVQIQQMVYGLSTAEVVEALTQGYGDEVAEDWTEWIAERKH